MTTTGVVSILHSINASVAQVCLRRTLDECQRPGFETPQHCLQGCVLLARLCPAVVWAMSAMSVPKSLNAMVGGIVLPHHVDTPERSNEPINSDAARVASREKSFGKEPAQGLPTTQTLEAAMNAVRQRNEYTELLLRDSASNLRAGIKE